MRLKPTIAAATLLAAVPAFLASPASAQQPPAERVAPVCTNCHQQSMSSILLTAHGAESDAKGTACQACHGDATQHLQDPKKFKPVGALASATATATEKSAVCLSCHSGQRQLENWAVAKHRKVDVTCVNCHSVHQTPSAANTKQIRSAQFAAVPYTTTSRSLSYKNCIECHRDTRAEILKPSHHALIESKVTLSRVPGSTDPGLQPLQEENLPYNRFSKSHVLRASAPPCFGSIPEALGRRSTNCLFPRSTSWRDGFRSSDSV